MIMPKSEDNSKNSIFVKTRSFWNASLKVSIWENK